MSDANISVDRGQPEARKGKLRRGFTLGLAAAVSGYLFGVPAVRLGYRKVREVLSSPAPDPVQTALGDIADFLQQRFDGELSKGRLRLAQLFSDRINSSALRVGPAVSAMQVVNNPALLKGSIDVRRLGAIITEKGESFDALMYFSDVYAKARLTGDSALDYAADKTFIALNEIGGPKFNSAAVQNVLAVFSLDHLTPTRGFSRRELLGRRPVARPQ